MLLRYGFAGLALLSAPVRADDMGDWLAALGGSHDAVHAAQPSWSSPLVTTTGLLEQRLRVDVDQQHAGNGADSTVLDDSRGLDLIVGDSQEIQIAIPPYMSRHTPGARSQTGFGDGAVFRLEQRLSSSPASGDDYIVTGWLQVQAPSGIAAFTNDTWALQPTMAFGKGWGRFDVQATVGGVLPLEHTSTLGNQAQTNVALQYHLGEVFWPELEASWTYYGGGQRNGLSQVYLTPGLVVGRFKLNDTLKATFGVGYQTALAPDYRAKPLTPAYDHAWIFSSRINF